MSFPVGQYVYALLFIDGKINFSDLLRGGTQTEDREVSPDPDAQNAFARYFLQKYIQIWNEGMKVQRTKELEIIQKGPQLRSYIFKVRRTGESKMNSQFLKKVETVC